MTAPPPGQRRRPSPLGILGSLLLLILIPIISLALATVRDEILPFAGQVTPDEMISSLITRLDGDWTIYAKGYDEGKFRRISTGLTFQQVRELAGPPIRREISVDPSSTRDLESWAYTEPSRGCHSSYFVRTILFQNGKVAGIDRFLYFD